MLQETRCCTPCTALTDWNPVWLVLGSDAGVGPAICEMSRLRRRALGSASEPADDDAVLFGEAAAFDWFEVDWSELARLESMRRPGDSAASGVATAAVTGCSEPPSPVPCWSTENPIPSSYRGNRTRM